MNQEDLIELSGEETIKQPPKYIVPLVRLHGMEGKFYKISKNEEGIKEKVEIGNELKGVMLKVRRSFISFTREERLFSNEHNSWKDIITIFQQVKTKDGIWSDPQLVDTGLIKDLRQKYPELRMTQQIYFLLNDEVVKLSIKGKSLSELFNYWQSFENDEHIFQFLTKIGLKEEESPLGKYYVMTFEKGEKIENLDKIAEKIKEVADNIFKIEKYFAEWKPPEEIEPPKEEIPIIETEEEIPIEEYEKII